MRNNGIKFQQRKDKHKLILPQKYFIDLKSHLEDGKYSKETIDKLVPEFESKISQGLSPRQIYKLFHPVAMHSS